MRFMHSGHVARALIQRAANASLLIVSLALGMAWPSYALSASPVDDNQSVNPQDHLAQARTKYEKDREICLSGQSGQDRETCLKEAGAALQEARRGSEPREPADYLKNALMRCQAHPPEERAACEARVKGMGTKSGSVTGGGTITEYREIIPAPAPPAATPATR